MFLPANSILQAQKAREEISVRARRSSTAVERVHATAQADPGHDPEIAGRNAVICVWPNGDIDGARADVRVPQGGVSKVVVMTGGVDGRKGWPSVMFAGANDGSVLIYQWPLASAAAAAVVASDPDHASAAAGGNGDEEDGDNGAGTGAAGARAATADDDGDGGGGATSPQGKLVKGPDGGGSPTRACWR